MSSTNAGWDIVNGGGASEYQDVELTLPDFNGIGGVLRVSIERDENRVPVRASFSVRLDTEDGDFLGYAEESLPVAAALAWTGLRK